jgi:ketopantoate reductase
MIAPDAEIDPAAILAAVQWLESKRDVVEALVQELREIAEAEIRAGEDISQLTADALMAVTRELHDLNAQMHQLLERLVPVVPREADEA